MAALACIEVNIFVETYPGDRAKTEQRSSWRCGFQRVGVRAFGSNPYLPYRRSFYTPSPSSSLPRSA
jgi:hypothetical protein